MVYHNKMFDNVLPLKKAVCKFSFNVTMTRNSSILLDQEDTIFDFNGMSTHLALFYALWIVNSLYCTSIFIFLFTCFLSYFCRI